MRQKRVLLALGIAVLVVLGIVLASSFLSEESSGPGGGALRWSCNEGTCETVINGDHASLERCRAACEAKHARDTEGFPRSTVRRKLEKRRNALHKNRSKVSFNLDPQFIRVTQNRGQS